MATDEAGASSDKRPSSNARHEAGKCFRNRCSSQGFQHLAVTAWIRHAAQGGDGVEELRLSVHMARIRVDVDDTRPGGRVRLRQRLGLDAKVIWRPRAVRSGEAR